MTNNKVIFYALILHVISATVAVVTSIIQTKRIINEIKTHSSRH